MKKITVTLSNEAEKQFNEIMYSLPKEQDGTGMCTQSQAINYALMISKIYDETERNCDCSNEVQRQGDGFVYTVCGDCSKDLD